MGWLLGIGAVAAVVGGVWYWRSNRRREEVAAVNGPLIAKIDCHLRAIDTPGTMAAAMAASDVRNSAGMGTRERLIFIRNQLTAGSTVEQLTLPGVSATELAGEIMEFQSKPCPSLAPAAAPLLSA